MIEGDEHAQVEGWKTHTRAFMYYLLLSSLCIIISCFLADIVRISNSHALIERSMKSATLEHDVTNHFQRASST